MDTHKRALFPPAVNKILIARYSVAPDDRRESFPLGNCIGPGGKNRAATIPAILPLRCATRKRNKIKRILARGENGIRNGRVGRN